MIKKSYKKAMRLLITATLFTLGIGCKKNNSTDTKPCLNTTRYSFNVTSEFSPQKEVYNVGDTIFLNSTFPKSLFDNISLQNVDYSNSAGIGGSITFGYMDTISHSGYDSYSKFITLPIIGNYTQITTTPEKGINSVYVESSSYNLKVGIKLKEKGLFVIGVGNLGSKGLAGKDCTNAGFEMSVTNINKHINLFQYALNYTPDALLQKTIYCFRVQ